MRSLCRRKWLITMIVVFLFCGIFLVFPETAVEAQCSLQRLFGTNRFLTAVEISNTGWSQANTVIIARSDDFPDAIAGTPLAHVYDAPILLTRPEALNSETRQEILRLKAQKCFILGGEAAISTGVEKELKSMGLKVERIGGANRFDTAVKIAQNLGNFSTAVIVSGYNFPDALAIAPYAARQGYPILLTVKDFLPKETAEALKSYSKTIIVGEKNAIGQQVYKQLEDSQRITGESQFDTAIQVIKQLQLCTEKAYVATGLNFADALTGSVLAAKDNGVLLLVNQCSIPREVLGLIKDDGISNFVILGGEMAVSQAVEESLKNGGNLSNPEILNPEVSTKDGLYGILPGDSSQKVISLKGQPQRIDRELYGWDWWIYNADLNNYLQVGIKGNRVVAVFTNGTKWNWGNVTRGTSYSTLTSLYSFSNEIRMDYDGGRFTLTLSEVQREQSPVMVLGEIVSTFYLDIDDKNKLTGILLMDIESFLKRGGYHMKYKFSGTPPDLTVPSLSEYQKREVFNGQERQILDLVNTERRKHNLHILFWHSKAAEAAREHSQEMKEYNYFSHTSQVTGKNPFDRLRDAGVSYSYAGENIAYRYSDTLSVHQAWMCSSGHRENILNSNFTHLGVGVFEKYYTKKFVTPK